MLVLFMLSLLGMFLLNVRSLGSHFKEKIEVTMVLSENTTQNEIENVKNELKNKPFTKSIEYISKEKAIENFRKEYNEDIIKILGFNPLFASLNLYLHASYANPDSIAKIKTQLQKYTPIREVFYQETMINLINNNVQKIMIVLLAVSIFLLLVAFTLIDSTIKLSMYSNRFIIKSMQMVGATRWFIARPFIKTSIYNGFISGLCASIMIVFLSIIIQKNIPEIALLSNITHFIFICSFIIILGILISWWSTQTSINKYLQLPLDKLY